MRHLILAALAVVTMPAAFAAPASADAQLSVSVEVVPACRIQAPPADQTVRTDRAVTWTWTCGADLSPAQVSVDGVQVEARPSAEGQISLVAAGSASLRVGLNL